jgi:hypothetical protein
MVSAGMRRFPVTEMPEITSVCDQLTLVIASSKTTMIPNEAHANLPTLGQSR